MEFGILGPLAVWRDGRELELGAAKQRALLAVMLLHAGETMSAERLVDALWGEHPPATAVKALQVYVSQLRKTLGEGVVETRPLGYVIALEDGALDLHRFERLLADGRRLLAEGAAREAGDVLREALALWRGEPLADFRYEVFAANAIGRLDELRLIALEQRLEADLADGRHAEAVPELEALVRDHPLRESLRGLLMRALYRSERQADALAVMQDARATLRNELGLDPGQPLQQLERAILMQDASLDAPATAVLPGPSAEPDAVEDADRPARPATRAQRKVVTVLSAEVGSPAPIDPEALRTLIERCVERTRAAAETHGGTVEELFGDRLIVVFGLRTVHEDDTLRALRTAADMRDCFAELGLEGRIGVESGEVIVGPAERSVTGAPVTIAARLEQAARPGEILLGEGALRLGRDAVTAERLEPLALKGGHEPVTAWRLVSVSPDAPTRPFDSPFVGRTPELRALVEAWDRVRAEKHCELVTIFGAAGVGKSRLVRQFLLQVDPAVALGRCLSYGAGITYWPVVDAVTQLRPSLPDLDPAFSAPLRALLDDQGSASTDEVAWAFRKFVEAASRERPLVLVFDDIQWGEDALLDLIEHVAFVSSGAPILLVCMARPDLLEKRPGWRGLLRLEPLTPDEAKQLIQARLGGRDVDRAAAQRIIAAADGNPLFVQELASMLDESGDEQMAMPPTIQAVLAARLDQLGSEERKVLEAAAVEGEAFHLAAVQALLPEQPHLTAQLTALVRKEFVRPYRPAFEGEDGFRFRHLLLRDAAYNAVPKVARSGLHERYAEWLEQRSEALDAFIGYHLEQAYRYHVDVLDTGAETDALAQRASEHLEVAAAATLGLSDFSAAIGLLERAASLPPVSEQRRARLLVDLVATLMEAGRLGDADEMLRVANASADAADDDCARARLCVERQFLDVHHAAAGATEGVRDVVTRVIPIFEAAGDRRGLCRARQLQASSDWMRGRVSEAAKAWKQAAEHARWPGAEHERAVILTWIASSTWTGATPVEEAIRICEDTKTWVRGHPACEAEVLRPLGGLHGFAGRFELARSLFAERKAALDDLGRGLNYVLSNTEAFVEMLAGNHAIAEEGLRRGYEDLEEMGENSLRSTTAALLARAILAQGRHDEAERLTEIAENLAEPEDLLTQIVWRGVRATVVAARGDFGDAESLAREAVTLATQTDLVNFHADALIDLAGVLDAAGRGAETSPMVAEAIRLYRAKGNTVAAAAAEARLDAPAAV